MRRRLKISDEIINFIAVLQPANTIVQLIQNMLSVPPWRFRQNLVAPARAKAPIVTEGATADRDSSIHIGTCEPRIQANFLHSPGTELAAQ